MVRIVTSTSGAARIDAALEFLSRRLPAAEVVIVGATRGAADDLARTLAARVGATFGLTRFGLTELAARASAEGLARTSVGGRTPGTEASAEAIAARAVFDASAAHELDYFAPVAALPGFPKALARTVHELRLARVGPSRLASPPRDDHSPTSDRGLVDLSRLLTRFENALSQEAVDDRAALFAQAADACRAGHVRWARLPILLLDVPLDSRAEQQFVAALASTAPEMLATVPDGDVRTLDAFEAMALEALAQSGGPPVRASAETRTDAADPGSDLASLRRFIFQAERPEVRERAGDVSVFSAPGEGREAVEIVRRILDEAQRGVRFDEMAVLLRTPQQYLGLLEHASARAGVPMYFSRGTERPDPAGRAFVALLSCAVDGLSAKRFDEYLSLGQVPRVGDRVTAPDVVLPDDEAAVYETVTMSAESLALPADAGAADSPDNDDVAVVAGTLRSPWKWEELIVESAVVGGRSHIGGKARWRRRLDGLRADYEYRIRELEREEPESARIHAFRRDLRNLVHLRQFALPIIETLAGWPERATWSWGAWLAEFDGIARRALRRPARVLQILADLRPLAAVGPVTLEEARDVLQDRLATLDRDPPRAALWLRLRGHAAPGAGPHVPGRVRARPR